MSRGVSRRRFLQAASAALAALGWSQGEQRHWGDRYGQVLAQTTPRKLALLVGINAYPQDGLFTPLNGCVNDVELQYQLLVHRFGFHPSDVVKLTDHQATRDGILTAFEEHLLKQAQPEDVVVFHYSGHGSRVADPDRDFPDGLNSTLVPIDSSLPEGFPQQGGPVDDITGHTLFLLGSAMPTENFTMVLDCCHSGGAKRGNLLIRSRAGGSGLTMSDKERAYQEQWRSRLEMTAEEFIEQRRAGIAKGAAIAATRRHQYAADAPFEDFYAGAFTFVLTQYLWQQTGDLRLNSTMGNVARTTTQLSFSSQEPQLETQPHRRFEHRPIYFTAPIAAPAEAVITRVAGSAVELWLGGVPPRNLEVFRTGTVLSGVDAMGQSQGLVRLTERQGLTGRGHLLGTATLASGTFLQEQVRGVPTAVNLRIGLDESLGDDATAAQVALSAIPRIEPQALGSGEVHYLLGRLTTTNVQTLAAQPPVLAVGSIGLFSQGLDLVPDSFGHPDETVAAAVERLRPKLRSLLAARMVKLMLNSGSSRLNLQVSMMPESGAHILAKVFTIRGADSASPPRPVGEQIPLNTGLRFQIENQENRDLYLSVLVIDAAGVMSVIFPNQWTAAVAATLLPAGQTLQLPDPQQDRFRLVTQPPQGMTEVLIVASSNPLSGALQGLQAIADESGVTRGPLSVADPSQVITRLLQDVGSGREWVTSPAVQPVSVTQLAALSLTFEVV